MMQDARLSLLIISGISGNICCESLFIIPCLSEFDPNNCAGSGLAKLPCFLYLRPLCVCVCLMGSPSLVLFMAILIIDQIQNVTNNQCGDN